MARSASAFRQSDVTKALKAARAAGFEAPEVEIDVAAGKITVKPGRNEAAAEQKGPNEWDEVK
jgi:hypothetical protein